MTTEPVPRHAPALEPARAVTLAAGSILVLAWVALVGIDVLGLWGVQEWLISEGQNLPVLWFHLFFERGPIEVLQWVFLGAGALAALFSLGRAVEAGDRGRILLFGLLAPGLAVMFVEDAFNPRHAAARWAIRTAGSDVPSTLVRSGVELTAYGVLGGLMLLALLLPWRSTVSSVRSRGYLLAGYAFYFVAAAGSASRHVGAWYARVGDWIIAVLPVRNPEAWEQAQYGASTYYGNPLGYYLMDQPVEESLEFLGAALLFAFLLACATERRAGAEGPASGSAPAREPSP